MKRANTPTDRMFKLISAQIEISIIDEQLRTLRERRFALATFVERHTANGNGIPEAPTAPVPEQLQAPPKKKRRKMSADARARIGAAQRARWAKLRKENR